MHRSRQYYPSHIGLLYVAMASLSLGGLLAACSDDTADITTPAGGAGGTATTSTEGVGGIGNGPAGQGGNGGSGGSGNEGGTGTPTYEWDNVYGDAVVDGGAGDANTVHPKGVAIDSLGNIIVVGSFTTTSIGTDAGVDLGGGVGNELNSAGGSDVFVAKYNSAGEWIWSVGVGDTDDQSALAVAVDSANNIWVSGTVKGTFAFSGGGNITNGNAQFPDAWIAKLDTNGGSAGFEASYGQDTLYSDFGRALGSGPSGTIAFAGTFQDNIDIGAGHTTTTGDYGMFLARYDSSNNVTLDLVFGDDARQDANAVAIAPDGSIAIGGSTEGDINFGTTALVNQSGGARAVVAKLTAAGQEQYAMLFESGGSAEVVDLAFNAAGDLFVTGFFTQTIDLGAGELSASGGSKEVFVARYDAGGTLLFGKRIGGTGVDDPAAIAVDSNSFSTVVGRFNKDIVVNSETTLVHNATINDAFVIRLGAPGQGYWGYSMQAMNNAQATAVAVDPSTDTVVVVGEYSDQLDLGSGAKGAGDSIGMFVAKYDSMGDE